jgi:hypothetical protein
MTTLAVSLFSIYSRLKYLLICLEKYQGMAPTLIIVRVNLGVSFNTLDESANTLRLAGLAGGRDNLAILESSSNDHGSLQLREKSDEQYA